MFLARRHLYEDLTAYVKRLPTGSSSAELSLEIIVGIMLQVLGAISEGRLSSRHRLGALAAILRAIGLDARHVRSVLARLQAHEDAVPGKAAKPRTRAMRSAAV
ncbi:hypothetical protein ACRQ5Q_43600 (plasmid) [Bradyrhizobium sp. PMVTL-01]|uniref:hypothetical protein n=1 Tax=Bradyrhizobium sp. PMVTL-01 TaxID=3434999 RepID=UPI003F72DF12